MAAEGSARSPLPSTTQPERLGSNAEAFGKLSHLWAHHLVRAELDTARTLAEQLFELAETGANPVLLVEARRALGLTLVYAGDFELARDHLEHVVAIYDPKIHASYLFFHGLDSGVTCSSFLGLDLWLLGYPSQSLRWINDSVAAGRKMSNLSLAFALDFAAGVHQLRRDVQETAERAKTLAAVSRDHWLLLFSAYADIWSGWVLAQQGEIETGIEQMRRGLTACRTAGAELSVPHFLALLAEAYGAGAKPAEGLSALAEAMAVADRTGNHYYDAELHRLKGELLLLQGPAHAADAEASFRRAMEVAAGQNARSFGLRASISLARQLHMQQLGDEAEKVLASTYEWFDEGFDTADLREADVLLQEIRSRSARMH